MKKRLLSLWTSHKEKQKRQWENEINDSYNITEKDGIIYIMSGVKAIQVIPSRATASEIIKLLNDCRKAHLQFTKNISK